MLETIKVNLKDEDAFYKNKDFRIYSAESTNENGNIEEISIQCFGFELKGGGIKTLKGEKMKYKNKPTFKCSSEEIDLNDRDTQVNILSQVKGISEMKAEKILIAVNNNLNIFLDERKWSDIPKIQSMTDISRRRFFPRIKETLEEIKGNNQLSQLKVLLHNKLSQLKIKTLSDILKCKFETKDLKEDFYNSELSRHSRDEFDVNLFKQHPYIILIELLKCSFKHADKIALETLNFNETNKERLQFLTEYLLKKTVERDGSTFTTENVFKEELKEHGFDYDELVNDNNKIIIEDGKLFPKNLYEAENSIAEIMKYFNDKNNNENTIENIELNINNFETKNNISFNKTQKTAIKEANLYNPICIIGGAGTGKTTIVKCVMETLKNEYDFTLVAPTGIASIRLYESTQHPASTIHSFVYANCFKSESESFLFEKKCLIIDEMSMIDVNLMSQLMTTVKNLGYSKIIMVGDQYQLSSVGSGNVLKNIVESSFIKIIKLDKTMRQNDDSKIIPFASQIRNQEKVDFNIHEKSLYCKTANTSEEFLKSILRFYDYIKAKDEYNQPQIESYYDTNLEKFYNEFQLIIPMVKKVDEINELIKQKYNPGKYDGYDFSLGDKIMNTKNNKLLKIMNGDIGIIVGFEKMGFVVKFKGNESDILIPKSEAIHFKLAYAITVHKLQGSEFKIICLVIDNCSPFIDSCLLYTGVTRGKETVIIISNKRIIEIVTSRKNLDKRNTMLEKRIEDNFKNGGIEENVE